MKCDGSKGSTILWDKKFNFELHCLSGFGCGAKMTLKDPTQLNNSRDSVDNKMAHYGQHN